MTTFFCLPGCRGASRQRGRCNHLSRKRAREQEKPALLHFLQKDSCPRLPQADFSMFYI
jgi:hypothetical protein